MAHGLTPKKIFITGASDGVGLVLAKIYRSQGANVIGTGTRAKADLPAGFPSDVKYYRLDMTSDHLVSQALDILKEAGWDSLDFLILNAGTGKTGDPAHESASDISHTLTVNLAAPILLAHGFYPALKAANGKATFIGSVAHKGVSNFASYSASKSGLHGFVRALSQEWLGKVGVQIIHLGPVATQMHKKAGLDTSRISKYFLKPKFAARKIQKITKTNKTFAKVSFAARELDWQNWLERFGVNFEKRHV